jgi:hypothetical protein
MGMSEDFNLDGIMDGLADSRHQLPAGATKLAGPLRPPAARKLRARASHCRVSGESAHVDLSIIG